MPKKQKSSKKSPQKKPKPKKKSVKKLTKKQKKEIKELNEVEKLDQELTEVNLALNKLALNNKNIIPFSEEEQEPSEGLASKGFRWELDSESSDSNVSLERVNPPQKRLVPLEDVLEIDTSAPNPLNNNQKREEEFNPFRYVSGNESLEGPKYSSHYSEISGAKRVDVNKLSIDLNKSPETRFSPMYSSQTKQFSGRIFNPAKRQDISELGKEKDFIKKPEVKYTPREY
jgi:hypothetical protein